VSALLLAGAGFLAGLLLPRGRRRATLLEHRRSTVRALRRLRALSAAVADATEPGDSDRMVADALADVLHLRGCTFEPGPAPMSRLPQLGPDGELATRVVHRTSRGVVLPPAAAIPARHGRFVLRGGPTGCTLEERMVAWAMVAVAGQAAASELSPASSARRR
jgi:hypothetical protein